PLPPRQLDPLIDAVVKGKSDRQPLVALGLRALPRVLARSDESPKLAEVATRLASIIKETRVVGDLPAPELAAFLKGCEGRELTGDLFAQIGQQFAKAWPTGVDVGEMHVGRDKDGTGVMIWAQWRRSPTPLE